MIVAFPEHFPVEICIVQLLKSVTGRAMSSTRMDNLHPQVGSLLIVFLNVAVCSVCIVVLRIALTNIF